MDKLNKTGVFARGYAVLPKSVMLDETLTAEAKAIFALYCLSAGTGAGWLRAPAEGYILKTLSIGHVRYLKHRRLLSQAGLIAFSQEKKRTEPGRVLYMNGLFRISGCEALPLPRLADEKRGIFSEGYGIIPREVMTDGSLRIEAKALYALLCVCAPCSTDKDRYTELSIGYASHALMSANRCRNAVNELITCGYILRKRGGVKTFSPFTYSLLTVRGKASLDAYFDTAQDDTSKKETAKNDTATIITTHAQNTYRKSYINPSESEGCENGCARNAKKGYAQRVMETEQRIEADILREEYDEDAVDAIVTLIARASDPLGPEIKLKGRRIKADELASAMSKLRFRHIDELLYRLRERKPANPGAYITACLYSAAADYGAGIASM